MGLWLTWSVDGAVVKVGILESKDNGAVVNVVSRWGCGQGRNT